MSVFTVEVYITIYEAYAAATRSCTIVINIERNNLSVTFKQ